MRYTPFDKGFEDISASDLATLRNVAEGWYVEYKSQLPITRDLAKSLSSFANQRGGCLFIGVQENPDSTVAGEFPGVEKDEVPKVLESIRNAAKDIVRPQVPYVTRTLEGPIDPIGLGSGRCIVVVQVPEGNDTPYIHNDGRIYIRIGDSSSPTSAKDRSTFDLLYQRGERKRAYLKELVEKSPELSEAEEGQCYIHLSILSDPYGTLGHWYEGTFSDFAESMRGTNIPFDNVYTAPNGFIARQVNNNDRYFRVLTWEFSRSCHSFITIPFPVLPLIEPAEPITPEARRAWEMYPTGMNFVSSLLRKRLTTSRVLNLNILLPLLRVIFSRHRTLVGQANVRGPFYVKALIDNVWRTVPFVDVEEYITHVEEFDIPVVQDSRMLVPSGTSIGSFVMSPELENVPSESEGISDKGAIVIWVRIMEALGIPGELLLQAANEMLQAGSRESEIQRSKT